MNAVVLNPASPTADTPTIVPYTPPVSDIVFDPLKMLERERQIQLNELQILTDAPPGVLLEGTGPEVLVGLDAEWGFDPDTQSNIVTSVQFHVVGECGEFAHIHYVKGDRPKFDKLLTEVILMAMEAGVILEWPKTVTVSAFFLRADLTAFSDLARFKTQFDSVGGSVGTRGEGIAFDAHIEPQDIERLTRSRRFIVDDEGRGRLLQVRFVDLVRHTPVGTNLAEVGVLLGQEKIELPPGAIENMPQLLIDDPELYAEYAAQDALIAVYFLCRLKESIARLLGKPKLPLTNSGVSVSLFKKTLKDAGLKFNEVFGRRMQRVSVWDEENGRVRTVSEDALLPMRAIHAAFVTMTAHGGRGECFHVGPTPVGVWYDIDLATPTPRCSRCSVWWISSTPTCAWTSGSSSATCSASRWSNSGIASMFARPCFRSKGKGRTCSSCEAASPTARRRRSRQRFTSTRKWRSASSTASSIPGKTPTSAPSSTS